MNPNTTPPEGLCGRESAQEATEALRGVDTENATQAGVQGFVPGWAPHMDAYAKNFPQPVQHAGHGSPCEDRPDGSCAQPAPADLRDQIAAAIVEVQAVADTGQPLSAERYADAVLRVPAIAEALAALERSEEAEAALEMYGLWQRRAEKARRRIDRVRQAVDDLCREPHPTHDHVCPDDVRSRVLAALDQQEQR
ncbi:hypothetical protein ABZ508_26595 [Streptomyces lavendulocolor]|uniref:Uncharacterized protein n=1 Tax=Streptomyces lavendulocolor TaxID=67316 RepID=A0ABV2WC53_9ACTN